MKETPAADQLAGQKFGAFEIESLVGEGGMAYVYKGRHTVLDAPVAIKVLFPELLRRKSVRARFKREARLQFKMQYPNIVRVIEFIDEEKLLGMVLDWVSGGDLSDWLRQRNAPLTLEEVRLLFLPVLHAMHYAHEQGVIHRDLKPHNIMLHKQDGVIIPKVMDFGIAWSVEDDGFHTKTGAVIGTPYYFSPEQSMGAKDLDHRTDIYSLGVTLFQMLSGTLPFTGQSAVEVISGHCFKPVPPISSLCPELAGPMEEVLNKSLAKKPEERFETCLAFAQALDELLPAVGDAHQLPSFSRTGSSKALPTPSTPVPQPAPALPSGSYASSSAPEVKPEKRKGSSQKTLRVAWGLGGLILLLAVAIGWILARRGAPSTAKKVALGQSQPAKKPTTTTPAARPRQATLRPSPGGPAARVVARVSAPVAARPVRTRPRAAVVRRPIRPSVPTPRRVRTRVRRTRPRGKGSVAACRRCVARYFQVQKSHDMAMWNPGGGMASCNLPAYKNGAKRCKRSCGSFLRYCKAYVRRKNGKCQENITDAHTLRWVSRWLPGSHKQAARACLKGWR